MSKKLKILFIGGDHPRHLHYLNAVHESFSVIGCVIEQRASGTNEKIPIPPSNTSEHDKQNFSKHFLNRQNAEKKFFGNPDLPNVPILKIEESQLNSIETTNFVESLHPNVVLIFGSHLIRDPLLSVLPKNTINLHGGLSPRYRGTATMFWPFYFLEPNHVGTTFHFIVSEPDAGDIIHQSIPILQVGDKIHDVACKTIIQSSKDIVKLLKILETDNEWKVFKQKGTGKNFLESDFKPEHLRVIYDQFNDEIVDEFLTGKITPKKPKIITQF